MLKKDFSSNNNHILKKNLYTILKLANETGKKKTFIYFFSELKNIHFCQCYMVV